MQNFTSTGQYSTLEQLHTRLLLKESCRQSNGGAKSINNKALYFRGGNQHHRGGSLQNRHNGGMNNQHGYSPQSFSSQNHSSLLNMMRCFYCSKHDHLLHMCPERLADSRSLEADMRAKLGIKPAYPFSLIKVVQQEWSWLETENGIITDTVYSLDGNHQIFETVILSLDLNNFDSCWYLDLGAT